MPFCFARRFASAMRIIHERGGSRERGFSLRTDSSPRFYELMSISVPDGTPEELIETADAVAGYIAAAGGSVLRASNESPWGRRRLAYPIRHNSADLRDGFYTLYHFEIKPEGIEDIEREMRLNERIIRHLLLTLDSEPIFVEETEEGAEGAEGAVGEGVVAEGDVVVEEVVAVEPVAEAIEVVDGEPVEVIEVVEGEPVAEVIEAVEAEPVAEVIEVVDVEPVAEVVEVAAEEE